MLLLTVCRIWASQAQFRGYLVFKTRSKQYFNNVRNFTHSIVPDQWKSYLDKWDIFHSRLSDKCEILICWIFTTEQLWGGKWEVLLGKWFFRSLVRWTSRFHLEFLTLFSLWSFHQKVSSHSTSITSNIRRTLAGNKIVDHSDVVGASPVGAAPTTSSFSTWHLASRDSAKTVARQYENLLSVEIWCVLY